MSNGVSVIIPTYNRAALLRETLDSVLQQSRPAEEILVVDDCSPDETVQVVAQYADRVRLIRKTENRGKAHSINLALAECTQPLVWIVDDDDLIDPTALETLVGLLADKPEAGFAYGRHARFSIDPEGNRTDMGTGYWTACSEDDFFVRTLEDFFVHQPGMIVRRSVIDKAGALDESLVRSQDYDFLVRIARLSDCAKTENVVFFQRQHDGMRGTKDTSFSAAQRDEKWIAYDQKIFSGLRDSLTLDEYLPGRDDIQSDQDRRRALLQRGVIMGRKKMWSLAAEDFMAAARIAPSPLTSDELAILKRAFGSKYGCGEVLAAPFPRKAFRQLYRTSPSGRAISRALAAGLKWRIRQAARNGAYRDAIGYARQVFNLHFGL
jgi:glycosyltransferase involved in cell wall biosynthesis